MSVHELVCSECGDGGYRDQVCTSCGHEVSTADIFPHLDDNESLAVTSAGFLAVVTDD